MNIDGKKVAVAGGAGFLGSHTVDVLLRHNCAVTVLDSFDRGVTNNLPASNENLTVQKVDLLDVSNLRNSLSGVDVLFDMAARVSGNRELYQNPAELLRTNTSITLNVAKAAAEANVERIVFASSSCVYDSPQVRVPTREIDLALPLVSHYGWSKLLGERIYSAHSEQFGLSVGIARIFNTYGPRDSLTSPHVIPEFIRKANDLESRSKSIFEILGDGKQTRSFLHVSDLVRGLIDLAESGQHGVFNFGSDQEIAIIDLAHTILRTLNVDPDKVEFVYTPITPNDARKRAADSTKAKDAFGWKPSVDLEEGIRSTIEAYGVNCSNIELLNPSSVGEHGKIQA